MTLRLRATRGERFAPDAFDDQLGNEIPLTISSRQVGLTRLIAAKVHEDGSAVDLTIEVFE
jgi:hypothetical protein